MMDTANLIAKQFEGDKDAWKADHAEAMQCSTLQDLLESGIRFRHPPKLHHNRQYGAGLEDSAATQATRGPRSNSWSIASEARLVFQRQARMYHQADDSAKPSNSNDRGYRVSHDAMEPYCIGEGSAPANRQGVARRPVQNVLVPSLRVCPPPWIRCRNLGRFDPGLLRRTS